MSTDNTQETQGTQQQVDPAASMSLLKAILENPLDAGYGAYHDEPVRGRAGVLKQTITILIAIALGIGIRKIGCLVLKARIRVLIVRKLFYLRA